MWQEVLHSAAICISDHAAKIQNTNIITIISVYNVYTKHFSNFLNNSILFDFNLINK